MTPMIAAATARAMNIGVLFVAAIRLPMLPLVAVVTAVSDEDCPPPPAPPPVSEERNPMLFLFDHEHDDQNQRHDRTAGVKQEVG